MSKQVCSIEQMQRLQEIGVDTSNASMCYRRRTYDSRGMEKVGKWSLAINSPIIVSNFEIYETIPTFTLQDILDILPREIVMVGCFWSASLYIDFANERIVYGNTDLYGFKTYHEEVVSRELIDATYNMLVWAIENGFLGKEETK